MSNRSNAPKGNKSSCRNTPPDFGALIRRDIARWSNPAHQFAEIVAAIRDIHQEFQRDREDTLRRLESYGSDPRATPTRPFERLIGVDINVVAKALAKLETDSQFSPALLGALRAAKIRLGVL